MAWVAIPGDTTVPQIAAHDRGPAPSSDDPNLPTPTPGVSPSDPSDTDQMDVLFSLENLLPGGNSVEHSIEVHMSNVTPVAGYQLEMRSGVITSSLGGSSAESDFFVSTNGTGTVLGFSPQLAEIPPGTALLTRLTFVPHAEATEVCLDTVAASSAQGEALGAVSGGCIAL